MKLLYNLKLKYLQFKQWLYHKFGKDDDDNIYPFW